jgi:hypothetical protein
MMRQEQAFRSNGIGSAEIHAADGADYLRFTPKVVSGLSMPPGSVDGTGAMIF